MAPVPSVTLAPSRTRDCPKSEAGWSPTRAVIGGEPTSALATPTSPIVSTRRASIVSSRPSRSSTDCVPRQDGPLDESGDTGVRAVGDEDRALAQVPRDPRLDGGEAQPLARRRRPLEKPPCLRRRLVRREPQTLALEHETVDDRSQVLPTEGRPDRASGRWIEDDRRRALVRDTYGVAGSAFGEALLGQRQRRRRDLERIELDLPGRRRRHRQSALVRVRDDATMVDERGAHRRGADVDREGPHHVGPPRPSTPGFRMWFGSSWSLSPSSTVKAAPRESATKRARA